MKASELKQKYFKFFESKGHKLIPSASLIPENDPTALFISAGMQPLVPYLIGEKHPQGNRLVDVQKCLRTDDIDEVGDNCHHTFFEMLGNWSLGDYFKKEAIEYSFEFLTSNEWLNLPKEKLAISVFAGDEDAPFDEESYSTWLQLGIPSTRIAKLPKKNNWWGPVGDTGPCGPDTEMFYWTGDSDAPENFNPDDSRWVEIWNDVFMEFNKTPNGKYEPLKQKNVDTGMGVERTTAILNGWDDDYKVDTLRPIIEKLEEIGNQKYELENIKPMRIITDHLRAAVFLANDGLTPSNKGQGYVLRRLIRRSVIKMQGLNLKVKEIVPELITQAIGIFGEEYFKKTSQEVVNGVINREIDSFLQTIEKGKKILENQEKINGKVAFDLYQSYGFPLEITLEIAKEKGQNINHEEFKEEFKKHQELSRTASAGMFKGGLADSSEIATKYHTATHLLNAALKQVLGDHIFQKGSNITSERMRFDFPNSEKPTDEQIKAIENLINEKIEKNLPVTMEVMSIEEAKNSGASAVFEAKYGDQVKVYTIGDFSKEVCGGPHVDFTGKLGKFKIDKVEKVGAGIFRLYATLS